jgi:hypothetical protein
LNGKQVGSSARWVHFSNLPENIIMTNSPSPEIPDHPIYPKTLRALTIAGAYGYMIAQEWKQEEYRTWPYRGPFGIPVLIHVSSGTKGWEVTWTDCGITKEQCPPTAIIGAGILVGCNGDDGDFGHEFAQPFAFQRPIKPVSGARYYWKPEPDKRKGGDRDRIRAFNLAWMRIKAEAPECQAWKEIIETGRTNHLESFPGM